MLTDPLLLFLHNGSLRVTGVAAAGFLSSSAPARQTCAGYVYLCAGPSFQQFRPQMAQTTPLNATLPLDAHLPLPPDGVCEGLERMVQERKVWVRAILAVFICCARVSPRGCHYYLSCVLAANMIRASHRAGRFAFCSAALLADEGLKLRTFAGRQGPAAVHIPVPCRCSKASWLWPPCWTTCLTRQGFAGASNSPGNHFSCLPTPVQCSAIIQCAQCSRS